MMYKQHYTTPFRDSDFNIRPKDKQPPTPVMKTSHRMYDTFILEIGPTWMILI